MENKIKIALLENIVMRIEDAMELGIEGNIDSDVFSTMKTLHYMLVSHITSIQLSMPLKGICTSSSWEEIEECKENIKKGVDELKKITFFR